MPIVSDLYVAEIEFIEPLLGTAPDRETLARFLQTRVPSPERAEEEQRTAPKRRGEDEEGDDEAEVAGPVTGLHRDEHGPFLYDYMLMGYLRERGNQLREQLGVKNLRAKIEYYVYLRPRRIYLHGQEGEPVVRTLRAQTPKGQRVTIAVSEQMLPGTTCTFEVQIVRNKEVTPEIVRTLLEFGELQGCGQWRTGGFGRFRLLRWEAKG